jgi:16S rRNA (cytosine967-C5)-methyltransferase
MKNTKSDKKEAFLKAFDEIWTLLFSTPIHLDSALYKQPPRFKGALAQILPVILLRPVSEAQMHGIGVKRGEPWNLTPEQLVNWRPARLLAEKLYEGLIQGKSNVKPVSEDFPPHFLEEWKHTWGEGLTSQLWDTLGRSAPLFLRTNRNLPAAQMVKEWNSKFSDRALLKCSSLSPSGVEANQYVNLFDTEWFEKGSFEIQDVGSQRMAYFALWPELFGDLLAKQPGKVSSSSPSVSSLPEKVKPMTIIDACAGAGGKSLAFADALLGKGRVFAYDVSEKKLQALKKRARRAGLSNVQTACVKEGREEELVSQFAQSADLVLVDAPCSGWGVLRRNPDIKWRQNSDVWARMPQIQKKLLSQYSALVKVGGTLVFGVCTFRKAETLDVVEEFLSQNPGFEARQGGFLGPGPCDGFFMQSFVRVK